MTRRYFGTDGIRGKVGSVPITPEFLLRLGWAAGRIFARSGGSKLILIGKDPRISGYMLESVLEAGIISAGVDVKLLGVMTTPGLAYLTKTFRANAGVMISASHNAYDDNGIKFFSGDGNKLPDEVEESIEAELNQTMKCVASERLGKAARIDDAHGRYVEYCKATFGGRQLTGLKVVLDCANGATYNTAPLVFEELGAQVVATGMTPNGLNINDGCGAVEPAALAERVTEEQADVGIAFDGDGDRVIMVDAHGNIVDGDMILYVVAAHRQQRGLMAGGVVGTQMTNLGLENAMAELDIPFERANVGDRYVLERLHANGWQLGGEASGHIICLDHSTTGDGVVAALQVLAAMVDGSQPLHALTSPVKCLPQVLVNVEVDDPVQMVAHPAVVKAQRDAEAALDGVGRVLMRPSGTEPRVRVMVEGECKENVIRKTAEQLAAVIRASDPVSEVVSAPLRA